MTHRWMAWSMEDDVDDDVDDDGDDGVDGGEPAMAMEWMVQI